MLCVNLLLVLLFLLTGPVLSSGDSTQHDTRSGESRQYNALRFGQDTGSYIDFSPDMTPFTEKFTLCSWVKWPDRIVGSSGSIWFSYAPSTGVYNEIVIGGNGLFNKIFGAHHNHKLDFDRLEVSRGEWFHYCASWSLESHTWRLYLNGELIGAHGTSSRRTLKAGGSRLVLGNFAAVLGQTQRTTYVFGGELYKLNIFSKELSASEIVKMANGGLCSEVEKQYTSTRQLKWEDIILQDRNGQVVEIYTECRPVDVLSAELNVTKSKLNHTLATLRQKESDLQEASTDLENANSRVEELSTGQLENTRSQLDNATICQCPESQETASQLDVLYAKRFFNKVLTQELVDELKTSWDFLGDFVGSVTLTGPVIRHFKVLYEYQESGRPRDV